jgi:TetR/AcrR family transcriptional repressor of nem operon
MYGVNHNFLKKAIGMRYPPEETAEKHRRILEQAARLFRERGFAGVSVSEIMKATGLTHGPFYNHFASKEALMSEALGALSERNLAFLDQTVAQKGLAGYLDGYLSREHVEHAGQGCLMTALAVDSAKEPATRPAFTAHVKASIARLMRHGRARKEEAARAEAIMALASMVGAVVLARAVDDAALGDEILAAVRTQLGD